MRAQFNRADSYRAFIQQALADPKSGGNFYALLAYTKCRPLTNIRVLPKADDTPAMTLAKEQLSHEASRCDGVLATYGEDGATFYKLVTEGRGGADPLMPTKGRGLVANATAETALFDYSAALATGDQNVVAAVLQANIDFLAPKWLGERYNPAREALYHAATGVVACELRNDCADPVLNAGRCAFGGHCDHKDYREFVLSTIPEVELEEYKSILSQLRRAASAPQSK